MVKAIEFKAGSLTAMTAVLREVDNVRLADALQVMLGGMGEFFGGEPTIIDLSQVKHIPDRVDWPGMQSLLRRYGLQPVALRGAPAHIHDAARKAGLAVLADQVSSINAKALSIETAPETAPETAEPAQASLPLEPPTTNTMVVERTIRSGQQIYARGADLVLIGGVSHGAEVIADGSIHCYGPLRGRALAGASGNAGTRILTTSFGPELISIAGVYRTFEQGIPQAIAGKAAHALLRSTGGKQTLTLEPLQLD